MIQESLKHTDAASDAYEKLLALDPKNGLALNNLAVLRSVEPGRLDAAYDLAKRARVALPDEPHTADTLGWIQRALPRQP
jgi:Flp pilus assembly protein TadD